MSRAILVLALVVAPVGYLAGQGEPAQRGVAESLEEYARGDFDSAVNHLIGSRQVRSVVREFRGGAGAWIERASVPERQSRTLIAAAMSVELIAAAFVQHFDDYVAARDLVAWSCSRLKMFPPVDSERWIHLAFIALAQGARDDSLLTGVTINIGAFLPTTEAHAEHAGRRFPAEGRFKLAHVTGVWQAQQIASVPLPPSYLYQQGAGRFRIDEGDGPRLNVTLRLLAALFGDPRVGPEARLRSGVLKFVREDVAGAREDLKHAEASDDPAVRALTHLVLGIIADQSNDDQEALRRFRLAYAAVPSATSSIALASRLFRSGLTEEAASVIREYDAAPPGPDPWEIYGQRDFRFFGAYRDQMRRTVAK